MRAMVLREHGGPEVLRPEELPTPTPGPHQLLVRVHATSVNPVDAKARRGGGATRVFPIVLGFDASGVVTACGPDVVGWSDQGARIGLPPAVCDRLASGRIAAVAVTTACATKTEAIPTCGPWNSSSETPATFEAGAPDSVFTAGGDP